LDLRYERLPADSLKTTHEEADIMIIQQMIDAVPEGHTGVAVLSDDTDVFVLLVYIITWC